MYKDIKVAQVTSSFSVPAAGLGFNSAETAFMLKTCY